MIFAGILAGGAGERIKREAPKQFISIHGKPIIYYALKQFSSIVQIDKIIVSCHKTYIQFVEKIINDLSSNNRIIVVEGGHTRHQSLLNIVNYVKRSNYNPDDKILFHEAARPLIETDIILNHINYLDQYDATNTLYSAVDTMMISIDGEFINSIPDKKTIYHGQTPQGYHIGKLIDVLENEVTESDIKNEIDLCGIYLRYNRNIKIVNGNEKLFKITHPKDLILLQYYLEK